MDYMKNKADCLTNDKKGLKFENKGILDKYFNWRKDKRVSYYFVSKPFLDW